MWGQYTSQLLYFLFSPWSDWNKTKHSHIINWWEKTHRNCTVFPGNLAPLFLAGWNIGCLVLLLFCYPSGTGLSAPCMRIHCMGRCGRYQSLIGDLDAGSLLALLFTLVCELQSRSRCRVSTVDRMVQYFCPVFWDFIWLNWYSHHYAVNDLSMSTVYQLAPLGVLLSGTHLCQYPEFRRLRLFVPDYAEYRPTLHKNLHRTCCILWGYDGCGWLVRIYASSTIPKPY